jgi:predicted transcriptional regulator
VRFGIFDFMKDVITIEELRARIVEQLPKEARKDILFQIEALLRNERLDWWDELSEAQQADLDAGIADADAGRVRPIEEVFAKYGR